MGRPCETVHPDPVPAACRLCWLAANDARYQAAWGLPVRPAGGPAFSTGPCRHLGEPTGETRDCPTCAGNVRLKVLGCAVHGACTAARRVAGLACCAACPDREPA